jgi:hypothetical protein
LENVPYILLGAALFNIYFWAISSFLGGEGRGEIRGQRSEIRDQRSEIRDQRSEVRGQRSEVRDQRADRGPEVRCRTGKENVRKEDDGQGNDGQENGLCQEAWKRRTTNMT